MEMSEKMLDTLTLQIRRDGEQHEPFGIQLLPQSLASMAIIPLQMKMVYGIGYSFSAPVAVKEG